MKRWMLIWLLLLVPMIVLGQQASQSVPTGIVDPVAMVAYNSTGQFKFLSIDQNGNLIAGGSGVGQTASGPFGFVAPVAPVAIDPNGNWQFLHVDVNGNLQTSGVSGTGGSGGTAAPFTGGTLTQNLYLNANPTTPLQAATKSYVDTALAAVIIPSSPTFQTVSASTAVLSGGLTAVTGAFSGALSAGAFTATTGTFSGLLSAPSANISGSLSVGGAGTFNTLAASSISVASISYTGSGAFIYGGNPVSSDPTGSSFTYPVAYFNSSQIFSTMDTSKNIRRLGDALTVNGAAVPISASCLGSNSLGQIVSASCSGSSGSMVYPGAGIPVSVGGTSWGTSLTPPASAIVGISDTQTLTNKSIASTEITGLPTFPAGTIVGTSDTQTLTNKSIASSEITGVVFPSSTIVGISDTQTLTNKTIASTEITGLPTFPSGTILGTTDTQTITNKSISAAEINSGNLNFSIFPVLSNNSVIGTTTGATAGVLTMPNCGTSGSLVLTWTQNTGFSCVATTLALGKSQINIVDDFIGGQGTGSGLIGENGWLTRTIGATAATFVQASDPTYIGEQKITTAATAATGSQMYLGTSGILNAASTQAGSGAMQSTWIFKVSSVTAGMYRIGYQTAYSGTAIPANGIYIRYDTSLGDTDWMMCTTNSSTESCQALGGGSPQANVWYTLTMTSQNASGVNSMLFVLNGGTYSGDAHICSSGSCVGLVATIPSTFISPALTIAASNTTAVSMYVDYFDFSMGVSR